MNSERLEQLRAEIAAERKRKKLISWISFAIVMLTLIGLYGWMDTTDFNIPEEWNNWLDELFFLWKFFIIMLYLLLVVIIVNIYSIIIKFLLGLIIRQK